VHGRALSIQDTGALVLETQTGVSTFFAADVSIADPPPQR